MTDAELSRIEGILKGTYKGPYLSRIEALLAQAMSGSSGGGGQITPVNPSDDDEYEGIPLEDLEKLFNP